MSTDPALLDPGLKIGEPVYRVRVRVDAIDTAATSGGTGMTGTGPALTDLRPGMTLGADFVLEDRRLWEVFLDPVLKALRR